MIITNIKFSIIYILGNSLAVQWWGFLTFTAEGLDSILGQGAKITQSVGCSQKKNLLNF